MDCRIKFGNDGFDGFRQPLPISAYLQLQSFLWWMFSATIGAGKTKNTAVDRILGTHACSKAA